MQLMPLRIKWLAPLVFFEIYLSLSIALFFLGPWDWNVKNPLVLASYLLASQLFIAAGYLLAWKKIRKLSNMKIDSNLELVKGVSFLKRALIISFILLIPTSLSRTGSVLPDIFSGLTATGIVYNENFERLERGNVFVLVEYLRMLISPFLLAVFPLTVVYWTQLSFRIRVISLAIILFNLSIYIATGVNKGIADVVVTMPLLMYLGLSTGVLKIRVSRTNIFVVFLILFFIFLQFFGMGQTQRAGNVGEFGIFNSGTDLVQADKGHPVSILLSDNYRIIFESLARYLGQGYYALSLSFDIEQSSTFGFGHSMFLGRNADAIFSTTYFTTGSIPGLLEKQTGWGMFGLWHSIYPWLASDVGFVGALILMGGFSYLFGISWGRSLLILDPRVITFTYLLLILFFYIPANNQIFQSGETCVAFFLFLLVMIYQKNFTSNYHAPKK